jgi:hypothetical protein
VPADLIQYTATKIHHNRPKHRLPIGAASNTNTGSPLSILLAFAQESLLLVAGSLNL